MASDAAKSAGAPADTDAFQCKEESDDKHHGKGGKDVKKEKHGGVG